MTRRPTDILNEAGQSLTLGSRLGGGGEGDVWDIPAKPDLVAKIYHSPLTADRAAKIQAMSSFRTDALVKLTAWPAGLLRHRTQGPIGLLMPKVSGRKDIHHLYSPKSRRADFQSADWRFLMRTAANAARAFAAVHDAGGVIGDVNHGSILVAQDATVKLIDCDSFQVSLGGRRYFCEVGVETFTPPELQGKSFKGVTRTPNHDNFGLAVMTFLLLFMGRHPFAGRYSGAGDMPISKAIEEVRFPYGSRHTAVGMLQPPGTPPLSIVGPDAEFFFERAFAREMIPGGRPSAVEWIEVLSTTERELKQCASNPAHWHHRSTSCPWCPMEGATGVPLFGMAHVQGAQGFAFDIVGLWRQIEAIGDPGPVPGLPTTSKTASSAAKAVAAKKNLRGVLAAGAAIAAFAGAISYMPGIWWLAPPLAAFLIWKLMEDDDRSKSVRVAADQAIQNWAALNHQWNQRAGNDAFLQKRTELTQLKSRWEGMPNERLRRLDQLKRNHRQLQLEAYLDRFEIATAKIESVGAGRKQTLESYGIETALDVTQAALFSVPGFGPKTNQKLLRWRAGIEAKFVFNPNLPVDPREIQKVEAAVLKDRSELEGKLRQGLLELRQIAAQVVSVRQHMRDQVGKAFDAKLQADADLAAIGR
tara:strand:- start:53632 stop:55560 length:1929 start_codon:yes stop_codon:yes gene_type:complete